jgi:hypothetical protein
LSGLYTFQAADGPFGCRPIGYVIGSARQPLESPSTGTIDLPGHVAE